MASLTHKKGSIRKYARKKTQKTQKTQKARRQKRRGGNNNNRGMEFVEFENRSTDELIQLFRSMAATPQLEIQVYDISDESPEDLVDDIRLLDEYRTWKYQTDPIIQILVRRPLTLGQRYAINETISEKHWKALVNLSLQRRGLGEWNDYDEENDNDNENDNENYQNSNYDNVPIARVAPVAPVAPGIPNRNFNAPQNMTNLNELEIANNAENAIIGDPINMERPVLTINDVKFKRYYQSKGSLNNLKMTKKNPFTRNAINHVVWYKPKKQTNKNKNKNK